MDGNKGDFRDERISVSRPYPLSISCDLAVMMLAGRSGECFMFV